MHQNTIIFDVHLDYHHGKTLDVSHNATNGRFRLVSCISLIQRMILRVEEFDFANVHDIRYATISYPWRGIVDRRLQTPTFQVFGSSHCGDPISVSVLRDACIVAQRSGADYIWIDRISVLQDEAHSVDKDAQIERMHEVYTHCTLCIVIPGGLSRFVSLDEETSWIHRGWTLQEAVAPSKVVVLFAWKLGPGYISAGDIEHLRLGTIVEVTPRETATADLISLVVTSSEGFMTFFRGKDSYGDRPTCHIATKIFGSRSPHARALAAAMARDGQQDMRDHAIWQSAQLRTASRPVDMVLSIMGLFGVTLRADKYGPDDRLRATVGLAKEILDQGRTASWLGISFQLPPSKYLSTFSIFPRTSSYGGASVQTPRGPRSVSEFVGGECLSPETHTWYQIMGYRHEETGIIPHKRYGSVLLERYDQEIQRQLGMQSTRFQTGGLRGTMDEEGYLTFKALSLRVRTCRKDEDATAFRSVDGRTWKSYTDASTGKDNGSIYSAIFIGVYKKYHPFVYRDWRPGDGDFAKIMIVAEHDSRLHKSHAVTFCTTAAPLLTHDMWKLREFKVGGWEPLPRGRVEEEMVTYEPEPTNASGADMHEVFHLGVQLGACSQKEVERFFERFPGADEFDADDAETSLVGKFTANLREEFLRRIFANVQK